MTSRRARDDATASRWLAVLAWALLTACGALAVGQAALGVVAGQTVRELISPSANVVAFTLFAFVGAVLVAQRPRKLIGWLLLVIGCASVLESALLQYVRAGGAFTLPFTALADWLYFVVWAPSLGGAGLLLLVFPDGRLHSRRWRWALAPLALGLAFIAVSGVLGWPLRGSLHMLADGASVPARVVSDLAFFAFFIVLVAGMGALVVRFRRGGQVQRQQIRWLAYAAALLVAFFVVVLPLPAETVALDLVSPFFPALLAVAIWVAVSRHGLYEIDRVVSRTVTYAAVTGLLVAVYAGSVVVLRSVVAPISGESDLAVAGSTLVVAALFGPVRRRVQAVVDRRFNRARYDATQAVEVFGQRLRDEVDLDEVIGGLRTTVVATVSPASVSIWVAPDTEAVGAEAAR